MYFEYRCFRTLLRSPRPEEMRRNRDAATLIRLLQQLGRRHGALGTQRLVILLAEAAHLLERSNDERNGSQLSFGIANLFLV